MYIIFIGLAFERMLSDDLNKKMSDTFKEEAKIRYEAMLTGALVNNEVNI